MADQAIVETPAPIVPPPDFPVVWDDPADERLHWKPERVHWPEPVTPFDFALTAQVVWDGMDVGMRTYRLPPLGAVPRRINSYYYLCLRPPPLADDERLAMAKESDAMVDAAIGRLDELWEQEWLPELRRQDDWWDAFDLGGASTAALAEHARESLRRHRALWGLHFVIITPSYAAMALFDELYHDLFPDAGRLDAQRLLQGFDNLTVCTGLALWELARRAERSPEVAGLLAATPPAEVTALLEQLPAGRAFLADLREVLDEHGQRFDRWSPSSPSWIEDPSPAIKNVQEFLLHPERNPVARMAAQAAERDRLVAEARARLVGYPGAVVERFEFLLRGAQIGLVLTEDHGYWIDSRASYKLRRVFLEVGRRLAGTGLLGTADEVVYLWPQEAIAALEGRPPADLRASIDARRDEMARFAAIRPPPELGTPAPPPPDPVDAVGRAHMRMRPPPPAAAEPGVLRGLGASAGRVRGTARVVRTLREASKVRAGDVLFAESTAPAWTPLFASIAAVVTDVGSMLGHCAVVAREYGLPAVVGVGSGTTTVVDGQEVEVDGDAGVVRILG